MSPAVDFNFSVYPRSLSDRPRLQGRPDHNTGRVGFVRVFIEGMIGIAEPLY